MEQAEKRWAAVGYTQYPDEPGLPFSIPYDPEGDDEPDPYSVYIDLCEAPAIAADAVALNVTSRIMVGGRNFTNNCDDLNLDDEIDQGEIDLELLDPPLSCSDAYMRPSDWRRAAPIAQPGPDSSAVSRPTKRGLLGKPRGLSCAYLRKTQRSVRKRMAHRFDDPDRVADDCHMILAQTPDLASIVRQALIGPQSSWHDGARPARPATPSTAGSVPDLRSDP